MIRLRRPEWGREVAEALPAGVGEFVLFEGASHLIMADEPDRFHDHWSTVHRRPR